MNLIQLQVKHNKKNFMVKVTILSMISDHLSAIEWPGRVALSVASLTQERYR